MKNKARNLIACSLVLIPLSGFSAEAGFFAGVDTGFAKINGNSHQTNAGNPSAGGGSIKNVKFSGSKINGAHLGYSFASPWSVLMSYQDVRSDISWDTKFKNLTDNYHFSGRAKSQTILVHARYTFPISEATKFNASLGVGVSRNKLSSIVENNVTSNIFVSNVGSNTKNSPAAQIGIGVRHNFTPKLELGIDLGATYIGDFETNNYRTGSSGRTSITPYKIEGAWVKSALISATYSF